jgi:hypothetical protein
VLWFEAIAEQKIREAMERGEFAELPGQGRPLDLTDDLLVPEDLRIAHRVLKNAGFLPPHLETRKEIHDLEQLVLGMHQGPERSKALRKLHILNTQLAVSHSRPRNLRLEAAYYERLVERLSGG